jgi:hypothetical protein
MSYNFCKGLLSQSNVTYLNYMYVKSLLYYGLCICLYVLLYLFTCFVVLRLILYPVSFWLTYGSMECIFVCTVCVCVCVCARAHARAHACMQRTYCTFLQPRYEYLHAMYWICWLIVESSFFHFRQRHFQCHVLDCWNCKLNIHGGLPCDHINQSQRRLSVSVWHFEDCWSPVLHWIRHFEIHIKFEEINWCLPIPYRIHMVEGL